jgi:micrococcal nuclease
MKYQKIFDFYDVLICLICLGFIFIYLFSSRDTKVTRVIDGDTFITNRGDRVRLIGVDAPELPSLRGIESKMYLNQLIHNKVVILERDEISDNKDKYGRLLRYVYLDKKDVNLHMIKSRYAKPYLYFNFEKLNQYKYYE